MKNILFAPCAMIRRSCFASATREATSNELLPAPYPKKYVSLRNADTPSLS